MKYPKIIAALREHNANRWRIGGLLVEECGPPPGKGSHNTEEDNTSKEKMREIAIEAFENGIEIQMAYLMMMRRIAYEWRKHADTFSRPFFEHAARCGNPRTYERIVALAKKQNKPLTVEFILKTLAKPPPPKSKPDPATRLKNELSKAQQCCGAAVKKAKDLRSPLVDGIKKDCLRAIDKSREYLDAVERIIVGEVEVIEGHTDKRRRGQYHADKRANNKRKHLRVVEGGHDVG